MKLRIVSKSGHGHDTLLFDADTDKPIDTDVMAIHLKIDQDMVWTAVLDVSPVVFDVVAQARIRTVCAKCKAEIPATKQED